ncbi:MAG: DNA topoisomerase, partial [Candidatus Ornithomonoglobus sp.]
KEYELCATSARVIKPGYLAIFKDMKKEEPTALSDILPGRYNAKPLVGNTEEKETKPPARYTKATLNEDMTRIAKYVTDPKIKKLLELKDKDKKGENGSIGTSATRSAIIDGLVKKGYLEEKGKKLISTPLGRELYRILPDEIKKADMTAEWWAMQEDIRCGKAGYETLTHNVLETIEKIIKNQYPAVDQTVMGDQMIKRHNSRPGSRQIQILGKCPMCGGNVIEGTKGYGCANWKPPMSCKFVIWKKHKSGLFKNQNFTKTMVKKWLARKPVTCKKLTTKTGNIFEADVSMRINPAGQYGPVEFDLTFKEKKPETPKAPQIQENYAPDSSAPAPPPSQYQPPEELPPDFWG